MLPFAQGLGPCLWSIRRESRSATGRPRPPTGGVFVFSRYPPLLSLLLAGTLTVSFRPAPFPALIGVTFLFFLPYPAASTAFIAFPNRVCRFPLRSRRLADCYVFKLFSSRVTFAIVSSALSFLRFLFSLFTYIQREVWPAHPRFAHACLFLGPPLRGAPGSATPV
ncbi:hypothetical protein RSAG8_07209, partial [Rhizoctonia solani AG-8 WAC10335]